MVAVPITPRYAHSPHLLYALVKLASYYVPSLLHRDSITEPVIHVLSSRATDTNKNHVRYVIFVVLIPVLVLLSGLFAGLTLGYMSLDETQLNVLSVSGTSTQRKYANKIKPIRKNGHLLLVTLLLANMIVNETLPVISDPILGGGFQSVVVSTVLIVIFSEVIPQSLFTRHGLYLGAKMAGFTQLLIYALGIVAWPMAKLLEFVLGAHHGIIYRRGELKELIALHSTRAAHGGDLKTDTVTIIGATLDLQEKVVKQAMTPIEDVFMLSIDSRLDYDLLKKICETGHSRVPVYEEIDVPAYTGSGNGPESNERIRRVKRILGILLVKNCVLLDPKDATPLREIPLNKVPFVPNNESLLHILDKFQEGRSHMAIVSRFSVEKAASVKQVVKRGLTQRLLGKVGIGDADDSPSESSEEDSAGNGSNGVRLRPKYRFRKRNKGKSTEDVSSEDGEITLRSREGTFDKARALESGSLTAAENAVDEANSKKYAGLSLPLKTMSGIGMISLPQLEQNMPADAVLSKEDAAEFLKNFDPAVMPLGIITLEDVLEELIGEEIYDEFDLQGAGGDPYELPGVQIVSEKAEDRANTSVPADSSSGPYTPATSGILSFAGLQIPKPLKAFDLFALRSHSAPPGPRVINTPINPAADGDQITDPPVKSKSAQLEENVTKVTDTVSQTMTKITIHPTRRTTSSVSSEGEMLEQDTVPHNPAEDATTTIGPTSECRKSKSTPPVTAPVSTVQFSSPAASRRKPMSLPAAPPNPPWNTSPAPSLEAILLDRKRRMQAYVSTPGSGSSLGSTAGPNTCSFASPGARPRTSDNPVPTVPGAGIASISKAKGTRFKSSPLGSIELIGGSERPIYRTETGTSDCGSGQTLNVEGTEK
ncbi:hypothetical protein AX15_001729 [Amanita polypyramis BW_CC]|nr:hypothetical protein AX15_001729 [Amanita polypyramis BW_CC]